MANPQPPRVTGRDYNLRQAAKAVFPSDEPLLLEGAELIDGTGRQALGESVVLIEGGRIRYAGPPSAHFDGSAVRRMPLKAKSLVPGLIEAHTHAASEADMLGYVRNGVTTIRFAGLDLETVAGLRDRIATEAIAGPRILSCGPMIDGPPAAYPEWSVTVETPKAAAAVAERLIEEEGLEALIVTQRMTGPLIRAVTEVAHAHGRPVIGQVWAVSGAEAARLGIDELHNSSRVFVSRDYPRSRLIAYRSIAERLAISARAWSSIDWRATDRLIAAMVEHQVSYCGMQVVTEFQVGDGLAELDSDRDFRTLFGEAERNVFAAFMRRLTDSWTEEDRAATRISSANRLQWMQRFRAMGGKLLVGTDMQFGGIMMHRELQILASLGIAPLEVIAMATGGNASALGVASDLGTIAPGKLADLVVLNRSPVDDLSALRDVHCVFKEGALAWSAADAT